MLLLFVLSTFVAKAQSGSINGKVLDETNQPLPGAVITIEGTTLATQTDLNGNFKIFKVNVGNVTVSARFIGYDVQKKSVTVTDQPVEINFTMAPDSKALEEVVVIGYGTVKKLGFKSPQTVVHQEVEVPFVFVVVHRLMHLMIH